MDKVELSPISRVLLAAILIAAAALIGYIGYHHYTDRYTVTTNDQGEAVTQVIAARMAGKTRLKVAELSGTVQSSATDVRGFGMLRSDQVVKAPFSVDYFVDVSRIGANAMRWSPEAKTLIVDAPDVIAAKPNVDESQRTLVQTTGVLVTRKAGEALSQRTSIGAQREATSESRSAPRMAEAREHARRSLAQLYQAPLTAIGYPGARVIVTFPVERFSVDDEQWDVSRPIEEVLANRSAAAGR